MSETKTSSNNEDQFYVISSGTWTQLNLCWSVFYFNDESHVKDEGWQPSLAPCFWIYSLRLKSKDHETIV